MESEKELFQFLKEHKIHDKENNNFTHVSMGKPYGKFNILDDEYNYFHELYKNEYLNGTKLHLAEIHKDVSPLLIDLDFKFDLECKERIFNKNDIIEIIKLYNDEIKNIFDITENEKLHSFVFMRNEPYQLVNKKLTRDGIHIIYPYIVSEPNVQFYIRDNILKKIGKILEHIPCKNSNHEIVDRDVIYKNAWLIYGSSKVNLKPYDLKFIFDENLNEININEYHFNGHNNIIDFFSIRNKKNSVLIKKDKKHLINKIILTNNTSKNIVLKNKKKNKTFIIDESFKNIVLNISDEKADVYSSWINIGLALHNIDSENIELLQLWDEFSKKSSKYEEGVCEKYWKKMNSMTGGVSIGSLYHWSRESNIQKYNEIRKNSIQYLIDKTINSANNYDIARVLYEMNKFNYVYSDTGSWYEFKEHRYHNIKNFAISLKSKISTDLCDQYLLMISENNKIITCDDPDISEDDRENIEKKNVILTNICNKLKTTKFKNDVMTEIKEFFIQYKFEDKLNSNMYLIGFENGVYDLKNLEFRDGTPDDYITLSTKIDYIPFDSIDENDEDYQEMLYFIETVFIDEEIRHYFLKVLASCLQGHNAEEKFRIWTGTGCHAKNSLIMMYDGSFKYVQNINVGDLLMGDDFNSRTVLELKNGFGKMFKIKPKIGHSFIVNDEHILCLKDIHNNIIDIKLNDYICSSNDFKNKYKYLYTSKINLNDNFINDDPYNYGLKLNIESYMLKSNLYFRNQLLKGILNSNFTNKISYYYCINLKNISNNFYINNIIYLFKSLGHFAYVKNSFLYIILGLNKFEFEIIDVGYDYYYGFKLNSNHRYLDNNFITHHNSNGKSKLEELFLKSFGEYCINFSITLLTGKRAQSNAASPEIAQAVGKRFAYLEEPSEGEKINAGFMKEMTGGSVMKARSIYKEPIEFKPQFKLHLLCNDIPYVPPNDTGTWRRMEIIEFKSKFVHNPDPNNKYEFKIDEDISNKINSWKEYFMSYLIEIYKKYKVEGIKPPNEIIKYTLEHQNECDSYIEFINNFIVEQKDSKIDIDQLMDEFKMWYTGYFGSQKNPISKKDFKKYIIKKLGKKNVVNNFIKNYIQVSKLKNNDNKSNNIYDISDDDNDDDDNCDDNNIINDEIIFD